MMYNCKKCTEQSWSPFTDGLCDKCWEAENIKPIEMNIMFTPWTIDTYSTFTFDDHDEREIENYNQENGTELTYDDFEWEYDHKGYVKQLADNWLDFMRDNIIDDVILAIEPDGEPWSPKFYNFSTENQNIKFTVDYAKLTEYIEANREHYQKNKIGSCDGFMWFGDDDQTMLHYYLQYKSGSDYTDENYYYDQIEALQSNGQIYEFVKFEVIKK
jgi:hypothetical protein